MVDQTPGFDQHMIACHKRLGSGKQFNRAGVAHVTAVSGSVPNRGVYEYAQRLAWRQFPGPGRLRGHAILLPPNIGAARCAQIEYRRPVRMPRRFRQIALYQLAKILRHGDTQRPRACANARAELGFDGDLGPNHHCGGIIAVVCREGAISYILAE